VLCVGIDAHHRYYAVCILDDRGRTVKELSVRGGVEDLARTLVGQLADAGVPIQIAFEASTGYGLLYDTLGPLATRIVVAHPGRLRLIFRAKRKTDRIDAHKIATLLLLDQLPAVHVPSMDVREWRALIEHRRRLVEKRVRAKNTLRALLRTHGVHAPAGRSLYSQRGRAWAAALEFGSPLTAFKRDQLLAEIAHFDDAVRLAEKRLDAYGQRHPAVGLLMTMPGVGPRTAECIAAYVDDAHRFGPTRCVGAYFGLVPSLDESGGRSHAGRITREGPATARKLLTEAAWQAIRRSPTLRAFFERIRAGQKARTRTALVATARHMVKVMVAMLKKGEVWRETPVPAAA